MDKYFILTEQDLPFRIKQKGRPKIKFIPNGRTREGKDASGYYHPTSNTITIIGKQPDHVVEHEIAHFQLFPKGYNARTRSLSLWEIAEGEIRADLLAYTRTRMPVHYGHDFDGLMRDLYDRLYAWEVSRYKRALRAYDALKKAVHKYWKWFPPQWKEDYIVWIKETEKYRAKSIKAGSHLLSYQQDQVRRQQQEAKAKEKRRKTRAGRISAKPITPAKTALGSMRGIK